VAEDALAPADRRATCPLCGGAVPWSGNPARPFCSMSCKLIDLGAWLDERHRVPGPPLSTSAELPPADE
jgi:endogenous inhibitor of DNA gyrase (YacG/DUF329 family)